MSTMAWGSKNIASIIATPMTPDQIAQNEMQSRLKAQAQQLAQQATARRQNAAGLLKWLNDNTGTHPNGGPTYKKTMTYDEIQDVKQMWAAQSTAQVRCSSRGPTKKGASHMSAGDWVANFEQHSAKGARLCDLHAVVNPDTIPAEAKRNRGHGSAH